MIGVPNNPYIPQLGSLRLQPVESTTAERPPGRAIGILE